MGTRLSHWHWALPGGAIAAWLVKELPLVYVNWPVVAVVMCTASSMLYAATKNADLNLVLRAQRRESRFRKFIVRGVS